MSLYKAGDLVWVEVYDEKCELILSKALVLKKQEQHTYRLLTSEGYPFGAFTRHEDSICGLVSSNEEDEKNKIDLIIRIPKT